MSDDLTIHHTLARDPEQRVQAPCVWCGNPTPVRALPPFRPDLGAVPLHLICGVDMRDCYRAWSGDRKVLTKREAERISRLLEAFVQRIRLLQSGVTSGS